MGMLREFFDYFTSVMMGRRNSLTAFVEPLIMGERYYRWGLENGDIRDFRTGMDYLHLCNDRDAPMASLLLRKYNCISDMTSAAVQSLLNRHSEVIEDSVKIESEYREERETLLNAVSVARNRARQFQEEGSLIKAKNEEKHIEELEENAAHLQEMIDSGEGRTEIYSSYDEICNDAQRFFRELDQAAVMVEMPNRLGPAMAKSLSDQLKLKHENLKELLDNASPLIDAAKKPGSASPAGARTGG